jgi:hypothetical protein
VQLRQRLDLPVKILRRISGGWLGSVGSQNTLPSSIDMM